MAVNLHIRIKKNYAAAVIKDLEKMGAIEMLDQSRVSDKQKKEARRLKELKRKPAATLTWHQAAKKVKHLAK
jgi:hypothetical protein